MLRRIAVWSVPNFVGVPHAAALHEGVPHEGAHRGGVHHATAPPCEVPPGHRRHGCRLAAMLRPRRSWALAQAAKVHARMRAGTRRQRLRPESMNAATTF